MCRQCLTYGGSKVHLTGKVDPDSQVVSALRCCSIATEKRVGYDFSGMLDPPSVTDSPTALQSVWRWIHKPVLAAILRDRTLWSLLLSVSVMHLAVSAAGWHVFKCPMITTCKVPCPGCGLTRAIKLLFTGEFSAAFQMHAFGPVALLAVVVLIIVGLLPFSAREAVTAQIEKWEIRLGASQLTFVTLWVYWIFRLMCLPEQIKLLVETTAK